MDRALIRFILRLGTLLVFSVFVYKWFAIPHGYWLGLTLVVVMQPDYGATRQRVAERVLGTLLGSLLASGLLFLTFRTSRSSRRLHSQHSSSPFSQAKIRRGSGLLDPDGRASDGKTVGRRIGS